MINPKEIFDPEAIQQHLTGGGVSKMPFDQLWWFFTVTSEMAKIARKELERRGAHPFPL